VENGDFNWIVPGKFLAFSGPHPKSKLENGMVYILMLFCNLIFSSMLNSHSKWAEDSRCL